MSASGQIVVIARWRMDEARVAEVLELVGALRKQSLAEPGCLGYEVFRNTDEPGSLLLLERYRDNAAIEAHRQAPHYRELVVERIIPLLSDRQVELLPA
ncbi:putative quinol monooxygenase [Cupriavidus pauculus]|uniref:putative quinol monooxygenase n=1 Tax=Cupriavidus pauculus TaxID=82633 RepID=UPI001EE2CABE|nr:putative quinol monooxygenase [Cupriavidus pauculus]GJG96906.1 antibiotic biosynthesis monooxygenase [Cupriavidus pauculus]